MATKKKTKQKELTWNDLLNDYTLGNQQPKIQIKKEKK